MIDFVTIKADNSRKKGVVDIYPEFLVKKSKDLMIRGKSFYAIWDEDAGLWSTNEDDVQRLVDRMIKEFGENYETTERKSYKLLKNFSSNQWTIFQKYCKSLPDSYHELDEKVTFSNSKVGKKDYVSKTLPYPLDSGSTEAYDELIGELYDEDEKRKLEWAVGAVLTGDSKWIQKFVVLYGEPGSGKSTWLNILEKLVDGYYSVFEAKALASSNNQFALEAFKDNPLVAIQHDGDLSRIEDNTKLNSIVSHEKLVINEKFKATYSSHFNTFIFMGTNKPVKITDSKSGIIRRLIDVNPSGRKVGRKRFNELTNQINFELGSIANKCINVYKELGIGYYDTYIPLSMISATNDFYNFMEDNIDLFIIDYPDGVNLNTCWLRYKEYCEDANIQYPLNRKAFKNELGNYFEECYERRNNERWVYVGLKKDKFSYKTYEERSGMKDSLEDHWLTFDCEDSLFDKEFGECSAQYANKDTGTPIKAWRLCKTQLKDIDTRKLHFIRPPENLIVIDFDLKNEQGEKDYKLNLIEASKWPRTYAELSKSGSGIHLHYYYNGDVTKLDGLYDKDIEVKVYTGNSALRRCVSKCNDIPIEVINSGLPLKKEKKVIAEEVMKSEMSIRNLIKRNLNKEIHSSTAQSVDFIYKILEDAYESGMKYDVTDMRHDIQMFAMSSSHQAQKCMRMVTKMKFKSDEPSDSVTSNESVPMIFYDVEVFPNLFIVCWKKQGDGCEVVKMINPKPSEIEELIKFRLVGFNNRRYDNHMLYACMMGYTPKKLYDLSQRIVVEQDRDAFFGEAYNLSYTDIYDFLSAANKMSLKKWEIKLGIHHQECEYRWDQPVPEDKWYEIADYCCNDVIATEAVWNANQADWTARQILARLSGLTVNDTTNQHTTRIIVGNDPNPQSKFIYTDLSTIFPGYRYDRYGIDQNEYNEGTKIVSGKSIYRGEDPGEGGYVYATPGMYFKVPVLDVESMHPHSALKLKIFGEEYTLRFEEIVGARLLIKHERYEDAKGLLGGKLAEYLDDPSTASELADALKTAINSVYGLTSAKFPNKLRDPRNVDNIVAKYGALFMINLKHEVMSRGFTVAHIKTDSIKIPGATPEIIQFCIDYAKDYGFKFEHESTYEKMCLVNESTYIAKYMKDDDCMREYGYVPKNNRKHSGEWTATGTQFQIPYVFKTLFSKEPIVIDDMCETKSVTSSLYLDFNEGMNEDEHDYRFVGRVGLFCPMKNGSGGAWLVREAKDKDGNIKYDSATGSKGYRWMEYEMVKDLGKEDEIEHQYYDDLVDEAISTISKYGDAERFINEDYIPWMDVSGPNDSIPFDNFPMNKPN